MTPAQCTTYDRLLPGDDQKYLQGCFWGMIRWSIVSLLRAIGVVRPDSPPSSR